MPYKPPRFGLYGKCREPGSFLSEFIEQVEYYCKHNTYNNARHYWKIKSEILPLYDNVARQPAKVPDTGNLILEQDNDPDHDNDRTCRDKYFSHVLIHMLIVLI